jgi:3-phenylpropionate/cinnamic acid dioxygenase small subunit
VSWQAYEDIRNLLGTYCDVMDSADWEALGAMFSDARIVDDRGREIAAGKEAVTGLWTAMVHLYDGSPCTRHLVSGPVIEVRDTAATCRSSFLVTQKVPHGELVLVAAGRYHDKLHVRNGRWTFTERTFFLDQEGDMSKHLVDL